MTRGIRLLGLAALATTILAPAPAAAQQPPQAKSPVAPPSETRDPTACARKGGTVGQGDDATGKSTQGDLSERLAQSNGVICPPSEVDPQIKRPTPPGGTMPVIPPPGSPGGDPKIQPK